MFAWLRKKQTIAEADPTALDLNMLALQRTILLAKLIHVGREQLKRHHVARDLAREFSSLQAAASGFSVSVEEETRFIAALEREFERVVQENPDFRTIF